MRSFWLIALFVVLWGLALLWHVHENKILRRDPAGKPLYGLLVGRSVQCLLLLAVCFVLMGILLMKPAPTPTPVAAPQPVVETAAAPPAQQPVPEPVAPVAPQPPAGGAQQDTLDRIKQRYEEALINYMFLKQCKKADEAEYRIIMNALQAEMTQNMAPIGMMENVLVAAQGSYNEIYSRLPCDHKDARRQEDQFRRYMEKLAGRGAVKQ